MIYLIPRLVNDEILWHFLNILLSQHVTVTRLVLNIWSNCPFITTIRPVNNLLQVLIIVTTMHFCHAIVPPRLSCWITLNLKNVEITLLFLLLE